MADSQSDGYLAVPPAGSGRGVLVLHAWWGLNDTIKTFCTRLAEAGFVAFAPDLYRGKVADTISGAEALRDRLFQQHFDRAKADLADAAEFLSERSASRLATIGFSLGAAFALDLSRTVPDLVRAVVVYYGTWPGDYSESKAAYLGHFAEADQFESQADVAEMEESLKRAGRPATFYQYGGTGHWFAEPDRADAYDPAAADLAWGRTLAFLKASDAG